MENIGDLRTNFFPTRKNSRHSIERKVDQLLERGISFVSKVSKELLQELQNESPQHTNKNCDSTSLEGSWLVVSDPQESDPDRFEEFFDLIGSPVVDLDSLRRLSWHGIPEALRGTCWQLLLGYLPCDSSMREQVLLKKSSEYKQMVLKYLVNEQGDPELLQQIRVDVPRTNLKGMEGSKLFTFEAIKLLLERVLYIWTKEHQGLDYYQGLSDIAAQFIVVFLSQNTGFEQLLDANCFTQELLEKLEVDTFWCMSRMLNSLEDHYANNLNTGIQKSMDKLKNLVRLADAQLADHLESQSVEYIHFSFRWWICLLSREFHYKLTSRLWDTYMAEGSCFASFHAYVCASFLLRWSGELKKMEFSELVMFLQHLPTDHWGVKDTAQLIEGAYCIGHIEKNYLEQCSFGLLVLAGLVLILALLYGVCALLMAAGASRNFLYCLCLFWPT